MSDINIEGVMKKYTAQAKLLVVEDYCLGSAAHKEVAHRNGVNAFRLKSGLRHIRRLDSRPQKYDKEGIQP